MATGITRMPAGKNPVGRGSALPTSSVPPASSAPVTSRRRRASTRLSSMEMLGLKRKLQSVCTSARSIYMYMQAASLPHGRTCITCGGPTKRQKGGGASQSDHLKLEATADRIPCQERKDDI
ncbi:hypothetical protein SORBI_3005G217832 [Sorghum bicolor]|uniref:Uncharacterized protein n=1 Tax=Sorghum bicolor TaxID=4558 RepID=A0A1Z5RJX3_SORBI|nr:hypothetical protein SORBI_3005G217832 [Sorghum bicolor]